jgi:hypothetical protein
MAGRPGGQGEKYGSTSEEIHESFPHLPISTITGILDFAYAHQLVP